MRAALAFLVIAAALTALEAAPATGAPEAKLRIVDLSPVSVQGLGFRPRERVRVVLYADGKQVRTVRANRSGTFAAKFAFFAELCTAFNLRATGASGLVAVAAKKQPRQCAALDPVP